MNAFNLELVKMQRQFYQEIKQNDKQGLIIVQGNKEELKLFEAMFKYQLTDEATTTDFFLFHQESFEDIHTYGESLIDQWRVAYTGLKEEYPDTLDWDYEKYISSKNNKVYQTDAYRAFYALELLYTILFKGTQQYMFVHLAPLDIKDNDQLQLWIKQWCEVAKDRTNFKLVVTDHKTYHMVNDNARSHRYSLNTNIPKLMEAAASQGDGTKKSGFNKEYNQWIIKANVFLEKKDNDSAITCLEKALDIAKKIKGVEQELVVLILLAEVYVGMKKKHQAEAYFNKANELELKPFKKCQLGLFYGAFLFSNAEKTKAKEVYQQVINLAVSNQLYSIAIEVHHLLAEMNKSFFSSSDYVYHLEQAMEYGRKISNEEIRGSSLKYIASLLLKEYGKDSNKAKALDKEMTDRFSANWQEEVLAKPKKM